MNLSRSVQSPSTDVLAARYRGLEPLGVAEVGLLRVIEGRPKHIYNAESLIIGEGVEMRAPQSITSGWACRVRSLADGRRQIMGLLLPGDAIGICARARPLAVTTILALSTVRAVDSGELSLVWRERERMPALATALDIAAAEEEHFMLCHAMRLGRQTAYERIANLFSEIEYRLSTRGMSVGGRFPFPLTQEMLADVVGLSVVHVNRTLQQMRRENHIDFSRGRLAILDAEALRTAGEFAAPKVVATRPAESPAAAPLARA